ncbi:hypothetical protein [Nocardioides acrostichi]|uniref:Lipoprotein n=1 Tax=Nocardioides acrostichi TaxID=2784339 RepID=A0A930Y8X1_9ACTN|nr:hypothetical protein [Nocardioides acrostichi]MBF4163552.1 hypothetical protein [Nocardioides acrostichi]
MEGMREMGIGLLLVTALAGCGGPAAPDDTEGTSRETTSAGGEPAGSSQPGDGSPSALSGYGASVASWEDAHGDSIDGYTAGSVYGEPVRDTHEYFGVMPSRGTITMYSRAFAPRTSLREAEQVVLDDFPSDASITVRDTDEAACEIVMIESRTIEKATGSNATAAFFSDLGPDQPLDAPMNTSDVSYASILPDFRGGPRNDLGDC